MNSEELLALMQPVWSVELTYRAMALLLERGRKIRYKLGDVIVRQGDRSKGLHIILKGQADVIVLRPSGKELVINILGPGQGYSFLHLYHSEPHSSSLIARNHCEILTIDKQRWLQTTQECPELKDAVIATLTHRLRGVIEELTFSNLSTGLARLAHRLLTYMLQNRMNEIKSDIATNYQIPLTQMHLATMLSLSRQRTHALLHQLVSHGAIELRYGSIVILSVAALRDIIAKSESQ